MDLVLDGRDITYNIMPDAEFKFFITANVKTRALRRFKELKKFKKNYFLTMKSLKALKNAIKVTTIEEFHP
jgi:cytidylate kinase